MKCTNDWSTGNFVQTPVSLVHAQMQRLFSPLSRKVPVHLHAFICKYLISNQCQTRAIICKMIAGELGSHSMMENTTDSKYEDSY